MKKLPASLIIGGVKWKISFVKDVSGGYFQWRNHSISISKTLDEERRFEVLIHEIIEIIMVNNIMRFAKCFSADLTNGDYLFNFNHDQFEVLTNELAGILNQFMKIK